MTIGTSTKHCAAMTAAVAVAALANTMGWAQSRAGAPNGSSAAYQQPLRPQFHWSPRVDYTNDPNGLMFYKGEYHLFYQFREFSDLDTPEWGHAVSPDLVHWTQLPVAIAKMPVNEDVGYGKRVCSGSAVVDWNNTSGFGTKDDPPLVAMFTDPCIDGVKAWQAQSIAYSLDRGRTWTRYAGNPVLDIKARGFRDPKVIWYEPARRWIAPIAHPDKGVVAIYSSPNLKDWIHINDFSSGGAECPDLFPMKADNGATKWVMTVASGNYWIGEFDGKNFTADSGTTPRGRLDYASTAYAYQTFAEVPNGRRLLMAWMRDGLFGRSTRSGPFAALPWQGGMTVVRELSLRTIDGVLQLTQEPVKELNQLREKHYSLTEKAIEANSSIPLEPDGTGNQVDIEATLDPGAASRTGIKVLAGSGQETIIGYDAASNELYADRSHSDGFARSGGAGGPGGGRGAVQGGVIRAKLPESVRGKPVRLRVLVDRSAVEVFADGGRAMSFFVYPIQSNQLAVPASPGDTNVKVSGTGGLVGAAKIVVNSGPNGPLGAVESVKVTSIGTPAVNTTLVAPGAPGDTNVKLAAFTNITPGRRLTLGSGGQAETVSVAVLGTPASNPTSLFAAGAAGDRNIKVANAAGFSPGSLVIIGVEVRTVAATGTAGRILSLAAPAADGATSLKIANLRGGFGGGLVDIGAQVVIANSPRVYTIIGPKDASGAFSGTQGTDGTGIILSAPIASALPRNAPVRYLGTGLTLTEPLAEKHAEGEVARVLGTGLTLAEPLQKAHPAGAAIADPGTGVGIIPALRNAWPAGTVVSNVPGAGVELFSVGGNATLKSLTVWQMKSAW